MRGNSMGIVDRACKLRAQRRTRLLGLAAGALAAFAFGQADAQTSVARAHSSSVHAGADARLDAISARLVAANMDICADAIDGAAPESPASKPAVRLRPPRTRCGHRFVISAGRGLNAWADGRNIAVTRKMVRFTTEDDALAFVVAHEMSHNILAHARRLKGVPSSFADAEDAARVKQTEIEADTLAVQLVARAGFDPHGSERLLGKMLKLRQLQLPAPYPSIAQRIALVRAAIADLDRQ